MLFALVVLVAVVPIQSAGAHAAFVSSQPEPGAKLTTGPGTVVLRFSEPLIGRLSRATVTAPDGREFRGRSERPEELRVRVTANTPGVYQVQWKTVSPVDGHTLRGQFRFGVGVAPADHGGETDSSPGRAAVLLAAARAAEYGGLLLAVGLLLLGRLARRAPPLGWVRTRLRPPVLVALAAGAVVVAGEVAIAAGSLSPDALSAFFSSEQGMWRAARLTIEVIAVIVLVSRRHAVVGLAIAAALATLAGAGHAAAVNPQWWGFAADTGYLVAAGLWAGGILGLATLRPPSGWRGPEGRQLLERFSPIAIPAFLATVGFGVLRSTQELTSPADLVDTAYGQVLGLKVLAVTAMVPLSVRAWRRRRPAPRREAATAVAVIVAAGLLAAFPLPPRRINDADAAPSTPVRSALPRPADLTHPDGAGDVLVGLTLRPARPGPNDVLVYLLPAAGEEAAGELQAELAVNTQEHDLARCGTTCRRARVDLHGGEQVAVTLSHSGERVVFRLPARPAPDGTALLERLTTRMEQVRSYRYDEVLRPGQPPIRAGYAIAAPDRLRLEMARGFQSVRIGTLTYSRESPLLPWQVKTGPALDYLPLYIWEEPERTAVRIIGEEQVDGVALRVLAFVARVSDDSPIWYRLWVDPDGVVHRAEMRARGHFMDHRYYDHGAPVTIEAPVG